MIKEIETYLHKNIPITKAMGIRVEQVSKHKVILSAPFANNYNHKQTIFGGSLYSVATLACWSLLYVHLKQANLTNYEIVIASSTETYKAPVDDDFKAECELPDDIAVKRFTKTLTAKGKARITLSAKIHHQNRTCVDYQGTFVAFKTAMTLL